MTNTRISLSYTQTIFANVSQVFPMLCPVKESLYLSDWKADVLFSESGVNEKDCVFKTSHAGQHETFWYTIKHDFEKKVVEFIRITPEHLAVRIHIYLEEVQPQKTLMHIEYLFTSLGESGEAYIKHHAKDSFQQSMHHWEAALNYFLSTGECLH